LVHVVLSRLSACVCRRTQTNG